MYQFQTLAPLLPIFIPPSFPPINRTYIPQDCVDHDTIINYEDNDVIVGNPSPVSVTEVNTPTYIAKSTDYFICVVYVGSVQITLPIGKIGTVYIIKDCDGNASKTTPIYIHGSGETIDSGTAIIDSPFGSVSVIFNGVQWSVV
jgi:hypothetical protein